jgi:hypothetical protein
MSRYRQFDNPNDPLTITTEVVVKELERLGYERMAGFVKRLGDGVAAANKDRDRVLETLEKVRARLHQYEPPPPAPKPMYAAKASERSDG